MTATQSTRGTPDLNALLDLVKRDIFITLNCHAIATVENFDPDTQTVQATINYKKTFSTPKGEPRYKDYPVLIDCPIVILSGGTTRLTFPIKQGDTCLILFNDRDIDNWYSSGQVGPVASQRMHAFSDAIALVGLRSMLNRIQNYDNDRAVLAQGETMVGVGAELIRIANATTTLKTVLNGLIDIISSAATTPAVVGQPLTFAPSVLAQLTAYKNTVGGLLE